MSDSFWDIVKGAWLKPKVSTVSDSVSQEALERRYYSEKNAFDSSFAATVQAYDFAVYVVERAITYTQDESKSGLAEIPEPIVQQLLDITVSEIKANRLFDFPELDFSRAIPLSKQIEYRQLLDTVAVRNYDSDEMLGLFQTSMSHALMQFLLASEAFIIQAGSSSLGGAAVRDVSFRTEVLSFQKNLSYHLERLIISFFSERNAQYGLFQRLCTQLLNNADISSGFPPNRSVEERDKKPCTLPDRSKLEGRALVDAYLADTDLLSLFSATVPFSIPISARLEHTHIIAGTGHGKTQLIQHLILDDLHAGRGFMVIDSQGDMIDKILLRKQFEPEIENSLSDKLIHINPENVNFPAALNMFSLNAVSDSIEDHAFGYGDELDKQILINSAVDMYQYLFGALFGAELTAKQGIIFRYLAKLMAEIPNATIHTLRALLEDARPYKPFMEKLDGSAKAFFQTQFFTPSFNQTKQQVLSRLWMVLSNQSLENLFSSKENAVDLAEAINDGKIVLVNTSKKLLQDYGSQTLGRFFIALLSQAVIQRGSLPEYARDPYMVYIDEAHEYIDEKIEVMLNQARKYGVGFCLSHQNLNQLGSHKHTVFSSTSVKLAGGISAKDATDLAYELKTSKHELLAMQKTNTQAEFACYIKNQLPHAIPIAYPFGQLESAPMISKEGYTGNHMRNIRNYCVDVSELMFADPVVEEFEREQEQQQEAKKAATKKTNNEAQQEKQAESKVEKSDTQNDKVPGAETSAQAIPESAEKVQVKDTVDDKTSSDRTSGTAHKHLQNLIKRIAQQRGFHSVVEASVFDGLGSVDVALDGFDRKIAIEVSVTTPGKWESSNIIKCLSAGFDTVIIVSAEKSHLLKIRNYIEADFSEQIANEKLLFLQVEQLIAYLDDISRNAPEDTNNSFGYSVTTHFIAPENTQEQHLRKDAIARVLSRHRRRDEH